MFEKKILKKLNLLGFNEVNFHTPIFSPQDIDRCFDDGGKTRIIFTPTEDVMIFVLSKKNEYLLMYTTEDIRFFLQNMDDILAKIHSPDYFYISNRVEYHFNDGRILSQIPDISYPLCDGKFNIPININLN